jgi:hypothetical protein
MKPEFDESQTVSAITAIPVILVSSSGEDQDFWVVAGNDAEIAWHNENLDNEQSFHCARFAGSGLE